VGDDEDFDDPDENPDPGHEDELIVESEDSGEEFAPEDDSEQDDEDIEMEEDEPDTVLESKKKRKGKVTSEKKGVIARERIHKLRDGLSTSKIPGAVTKQNLSKSAAQWVYPLVMGVKI
jgi:hypothetical protein